MDSENETQVVLVRKVEELSAIVGALQAVLNHLPGVHLVDFRAASATVAQLPVVNSPLLPRGAMRPAAVAHQELEKMKLFSESQAVFRSVLGPNFHTNVASDVTP